MPFYLRDLAMCGFWCGGVLIPICYYKGIPVLFMVIHVLLACVVVYSSHVIVFILNKLVVLQQLESSDLNV